MTRDNVEDLYQLYLKAEEELNRYINEHVPGGYDIERWGRPKSEEEFRRMSPEKQQIAAHPKPLAERLADAQQFIDELNELGKGGGENRER